MCPKTRKLKLQYKKWSREEEKVRNVIRQSPYGFPEHKSDLFWFSTSQVSGSFLPILTSSSDFNWNAVDWRNFTATDSADSGNISTDLCSEAL